MLTSPNNWAAMMQVVDLTRVSTPCCACCAMMCAMARLGVAWGPEHALLSAASLHLARPRPCSAPLQPMCLCFCMQELQRRGLPADTAAGILDTCPPLELTIWYGGHRHGRARCEVWLALDDGAEELPSWLDGEPRRGPWGWGLGRSVFFVFFSTGWQGYQ